jgi:hypothetical protein
MTSLKRGSFLHPALSRSTLKALRAKCCKECGAPLPVQNQYCLSNARMRDEETAWQLLSELGYRCQSAITHRWIAIFDDYRHSDFLWLPVGHN